MTQGLGGVLTLQRGGLRSDLLPICIDARNALLIDGNDDSLNNSYTLHKRIVDKLLLKYPKRYKIMLTYGRYFRSFHLLITGQKAFSNSIRSGLGMH